MRDSASSDHSLFRRRRGRRRGRRLGGPALVLASVLSLLTVTASSCESSDVPKEAPAIGASLELAAGAVELIGVGEEAQEGVKLLSNTPLPLEAKLRTGKGARALIRLSDGTRAFLRDETTVTLTSSGLDLEAGAVWLDAPPVESGRAGPSARHSMGEIEIVLSGGGASLERAGERASIYVTKGLAVVTTPSKPVEVEPGERVEIEGEGEPVVSPVQFWDDWTGGMGDHGAVGDAPWVGVGSVYAVDHMAGFGAEVQPLSIQRQNVEVVIDEQVAETEVEQVFFNPSSSDVEGWYWFTVPADAMIVGFALESEGQLVEAEIVERSEAAQIFEANIQRRVDPALLEWVDATTVRARIYPIPGAGTRRVVLRYQQLLGHREAGKLRYRYPMSAPPGREAATIEDFSLKLALHGKMAERYGVTTRSDARVEGQERNRVTMRRSGYVPRSDFELELTPKLAADPDEAPKPLRVNVLDPGEDQAKYVMVRWNPEFIYTPESLPKGELVVVVDTSAGSDASEHQAKLAVAEALLRSLSGEDRFALIAADLGADLLYPSQANAKGEDAGKLADATPEHISKAIDALARRGAGGATDIGAIFEQAVERVHGLEQPAIVYIGDGVATSGKIDGEALAETMRRSLASSRARVFTVGVGREVDEALLAKLAKAGGGRSVRVTEPKEAVMRALELSSALKTPTLTDVRINLGEGLDDVFVSAEGKLSGEELRLLARTHYDLPETATVSYYYNGEQHTSEAYAIEPERSAVLSRLVPRLWARAYVDELLRDTRGVEAIRGKVLTLGLEYGLMTPFSSFLALENDAAYGRAGISRRDHDFPVLTADAGLSALPPVGETDDSPSVLSMIGAAASAPLGCMPGPREQPDDHSEDRSVDANEDTLSRQARTRPPAPSASPMVDARIEPPAEVVTEEEQSFRQGQLPGNDATGRDGRSGGFGRSSLGLIELDALAAEDEPAAGPDRAKKLAAAGFRAPAPPPWVEEVTASELARRSLSGRARVQSSPVAPERTLTCSDASTRSLVHRRRLWAQRLDRQTTMAGMLRVFEASKAACELPRWRDERSYLDLLQARARTEAEIQLLLGHFDADQDAKLFVVQGLLRRLLDPSLVAAVNYAIYGGVESWWEVDRQVFTTDDPDQRVQILAAALANAPGDPDGERRMITELVSQGQVEEAVARGLRLREAGALTPELVQIIGELLIDLGPGGEARAKRLFSELVEYAPRSLHSRALLGDIFLRHGWYEEAQRQYELLVELASAPGPGGRPVAAELLPAAYIRLARAVAGTGLTANALDKLQQVQAAEGRPGEGDPRRFARLHMAAILAQLIEHGGEEVPKDQVRARLESLGLFEGPGTWELLLWQDLGAHLTLAVSEEGQLATDGVDASETGLFARQYSGTAPALEVRHAGLVPDREVAWSRITLHWTGSAFEISESEGTIAAKVAQAEAPEEAEAGADAP